LTLFKFWLVSNDTEEESMASITHPTDASIVSELSNYGVRTSLYKSSAWYNVAHSFGVFVHEKVLHRDLAKFRHGLDAVWNETCSGCYVKFLFPELYFLAPE